MNIFFDIKKKVYGTTEKEGLCCKCSKQLKSYFFVQRVWNRKSSCELAYCKDCYGRAVVGAYVESYGVHVYPFLPKEYNIVPYIPPVLKPGNLTVFEAADLKGDGALVEDHTVHAGKESWKGSRIGRRTGQDDKVIGFDSHIKKLIGNKKKW